MTAVACVLATGCLPDQTAGGRALAITEGAVDPGDPAVVAIAGVDACGEPQVSCTGALIAPRVVLTAAHCVDLAPEMVRIFFGTDAAGDGQWLPAAALRAHPDFDPVDYASDVGAIILPEDAPVVPVPYSDGPLDPTVVGAAARVVGFGIPEVGGGEAGIKRTGTSRVDSLAATSFQTVPDPAMTCQLDSGGPVFLGAGDTEVVAGITSSGDQFCQEYAINTRVDAYLDYLAPILAEAAAGDLPPPPPPPGGACPEPDGGCRSTGAGGSAAAGVLALALLIAARLRRAVRTARPSTRRRSPRR